MRRQANFGEVVLNAPNTRDRGQRQGEAPGFCGTVLSSLSPFAILLASFKCRQEERCFPSHTFFPVCSFPFFAQVSPVCSFSCIAHHALRRIVARGFTASLLRKAHYFFLSCQCLSEVQIVTSFDSPEPTWFTLPAQHRHKML